MIYTADGHFSNIQMRADLPDTFQQTAERPVTTIIAYFGTYTVDDKKLTVNTTGASRSDWRNTTRTQAIETVTPTELVLLSNPAPGMGVRVVSKRC